CLANGPGAIKEGRRPGGRRRGWAVGSVSALGERGLVGFGLDGTRGGGEGHEVVVPGVAVDDDVGGGSQFDALDEVVVDVGVQAGLLEGVQRGSCGATPDEPGLVVHVGALPNFPCSQTWSAWPDRTSTR